MVDRVELIDDRANVRILVQNDLRDEMAMREVLVAKVEMRCDVSEAR